MKAPAYMKVTPSKSGKCLTINVTIKRWGWPLLLFKAIKKNVSAKWYLWPVIWLFIYPKVCIRTMIRGVQHA